MKVSGEMNVVVEGDDPEEAAEEAYSLNPAMYLDQLEDVEVDVVTVAEYHGEIEEDGTYGYDEGDDDAQSED